MPKFNPISVSGYHIREAGSTAIQELAFTSARWPWSTSNGECAAASTSINLCAALVFSLTRTMISSRRSPSTAQRAASGTKPWSSATNQKNPRSWALRFHTQTAGCSLTAQQPYNNVVRTAIQALAAVLAARKSLHTNSLDEAWALPTEFAATIALRTQQIIAHETGVTNTVDPLGGSYFVKC